MGRFDTVLILGTGIWFLGMALLLPFLGHYRHVRPRAAVFVASILLFLGGLGWFGASTSACGGLDWLPLSFEWPIASSDRAITMPGGEHVVPHLFSGRVQIYDRDLKFLRGWAVPSYGKEFEVRPAGMDRFDVLYYGTRADTYLLNGTLVARAAGQREEYTLPSYGQRLSIPIRPWLLVFSEALPSWLTVILGVVILGVLGWREKRARAGLGPP